MVPQHNSNGQEGPPEASLPEVPEESRASTTAAGQLLQLHNHILHHSVVLRLNKKALQHIIKTAQRIIGSRQRFTEPAAAGKPQTAAETRPTRPQHVHPSAVWQALQSSVCSHEQAEEQFLSQCCHTAEHTTVRLQ